ncbi:MAG: hypothetical protein IJX98_03255 [Clostridia bacterium]|nr:hypothetical protein [Clostridia bacterium]
MKIKAAVRQTNMGELKESKPTPYAENREALDKAEKLDKIDVFDKLLIADDEYEMRDYGDGQRIGIEYDANIHTGMSVVLPHQKRAVTKFLSDFRGVGILADEVGMGKTTEAGMILSELAERKVLSSILVVAENMDNWEATLSERFGVRQIKRVQDNVGILKNCERNRPKVPMLMSMSDFCALTYSNLGGICFDAIVVDEAHNFSTMESCARGMQVLSFLMRAKIAAGKPYCILVSGTPHNGNLDSMFNLWYFITQRGAVGNAFDTTKNDPKAAAAHEHYLNYLCNGAKTISEFIENWKISMLTGNGKYAKEYEEFVKNQKGGAGASARRGAAGEYELRNKFLDENRTIADEIRKATKASYDGLLSSFMIRQSRKDLETQIEKKSVNYYFLPALEGEQRIPYRFVTEVVEMRREKEFDLMVDFHEIYSEKAVEYDGKVMSMRTFMEIAYPREIWGWLGDVDRYFSSQIGRILFDILDQKRLFETGFMDESKDYYRELFCDEYNQHIQNRIELIDVGKDLFVEKAEQLVSAAEETPHDKIIVFFDYYSKEDLNRTSEPQRLYDWLKENAPKIYKRVLFAKNEQSDSDAIAQQFLSSDSDNYILFANETLSESYNLQTACHKIINFSICYSPIKMDQRIGRIDRLGQNQNIQVLSFAQMNTLEGFMLSFFNKVRLMSGGQDDVILVTGCDNDNSTMKKCPECGAIYLCIEDMQECPNCLGVELIPLEITATYECSSKTCNFRLQRSTIGNPFGDYQYVCNRDSRLRALKRTMRGDEVTYQCDKRCALLHCRKIRNARSRGVECKALDLVEKNYNVYIADLVNACANCENHICGGCDFAIDVDGRDNFTGKKTDNACIGCREAPCKPYTVKPGGECPTCGNKLVCNMPTTFDAFAKFIWNFGNGFVRNFRTSCDRIEKIVMTLGNKE